MSTTQYKSLLRSRFRIAFPIEEENAAIADNNTENSSSEVPVSELVDSTPSMDETLPQEDATHVSDPLLQQDAEPLLEETIENNSTSSVSTAPEILEENRELSENVQDESVGEDPICIVEKNAAVEAKEEQQAIDFVIVEKEDAIIAEENQNSSKIDHISEPSPPKQARLNFAPTSKKPERKSNIPSPSTAKGRTSPSPAPKFNSKNASIVKRKEAVFLTQELNDANSSQLEKLGMSLNQDKYGHLTFDSLDEDSQGPIYLTSPRSIEVCLRMGIMPKELLPISRDEFFNQGCPIEILEMRYNHAEKKRLENLATCKSERQLLVNVLEQSGINLNVSTASVSTELSAVEKEKERFLKLMNQAKQHYEDMIRHQVEEKKKHYEEVQRLEKQQRLDEEERKNRFELEKRRRKSLVERDREQKELTERILQWQKEKLERKRNESERKQKEKEEAILQHKITVSQKIEKVKEAKDQKLSEVKQKSQEIIQQKNNNAEQKVYDYSRKIEEVEQKKKEFKKQIQEKLSKKTEKIHRVQEVSEILEQRKIEKVLTKALEREKKLLEFEEKELHTQISKKKENMEKERRTQEKIEFVQESIEHKVERILKKQEDEADCTKKILEEKRKQYELKLEELRLKELDKKEVAERLNRQEQFRKLTLLQKIEGKDKKAEELKKERELLIRQKRMHTDMLRKSKELVSAMSGKSLIRDDSIVKSLLTSLDVTDLSQFSNPSSRVSTPTLSKTASKESLDRTIRERPVSSSRTSLTTPMDATNSRTFKNVTHF